MSRAWRRAWVQPCSGGFHDHQPLGVLGVVLPGEGVPDDLRLGEVGVVRAELLGGLLGGIAVGQDEQLPGVRVEVVRQVGCLGDGRGDGLGGGVGGGVFGHPPILQGGRSCPCPVGCW
ncbi:hypothetical protein [Kitasatospora purpeofusca]|uniref:hypothetical protein n=1 Tax=Kitasatospora purpeofusca TaxID=67352 RepID=UPI0035DA727E